eukprot:scaffold991_cov227-Pinguiococcus_pyrenoidosus.AAC.17
MVMCGFLARLVQPGAPQSIFRNTRRGRAVEPCSAASPTPGCRSSAVAPLRRSSTGSPWRERGDATGSHRCHGGSPSSKKNSFRTAVVAIWLPLRWKAACVPLNVLAECTCCTSSASVAKSELTESWTKHPRPFPAYSHVLYNDCRLRMAYPINDPYERCTPFC